MIDVKHDHSDDIIVDADEHFTIDTVTRKISNAGNKKLSIMQHDHNSERYSFDINRIIDGHDLTLCNRVQVHYINIGSNRQSHPDVYPVTDVKVNDKDTNKLTFTWLISGNATSLQGTLNFLVSFECIGKDGESILYRWSSDIFDQIKISGGMDNDDSLLELYSDELLAWQNSIESEYIPELVEEWYTGRNFATTEEVAAIFNDIDVPELPSGYLQDAEVEDTVLTITKDDGSIITFYGSATPDGTPYNYLEDAVVENNTLTITKNDGSTVTFTQPEIPAIDDAPTDNSDNLVKSGGVKTYIDDAIESVNEAVNNRSNDTEIIYEFLKPNDPISWGYPNGMGNVTVTHGVDLTKYKSIKIYYTLKPNSDRWASFGKNNVVELDISTFHSGEYSTTAVHRLTTSGTSSDNLAYAYFMIYDNLSVFKSYFSRGTTLMSDDDAFVYKMEGVLK